MNFHIILISILCLAGITVRSQSLAQSRPITRSQSTAPHAAPPTLDQDNIIWTTPSHDASQSMPCGGHDIGLNVWVEHGDLLLYFARSGSFDENNALLKGGRVRIRLTPNPFDDTTHFRQEVDLKNGDILITTKTIKANIWVDVFHPIIHIELSGSRPTKAEAIYESWRATDREMTGKANNANSYKWAPKKAPGGKVITWHDSIRFQNDRIVFYHRNRSNTVFDVTVHQQGLDSIKTQLFNPLNSLTFGGQMLGTGMIPAGTTNGRYLDTDFTGWRLQSQHPSRTHHIVLTLATAQTPDQQAWEDTLKKAAETTETAHSAQTTQTTKTNKTNKTTKSNSKNAHAATRAWWQSFWQRSFIFINPDDPGNQLHNSSNQPAPSDNSPQWQAGRNYQLFRYMLACNAFGAWPTKFNGGLFTYDPCLTDSTNHSTPDFRNWGGGTMTAQNQRLVYFPLTKSGDFDVQQPQLDFYRKLLHNAELRTRVYWGHDGACFTEQLENFGLPNPAEYGWDMPADHDKGVEYNAWLEYEWDTVLEFCLMMLDRQQYTGTDISEYLPLIQSCLTFFNEHYQYLAAKRGRRSLDGDGHLILYPGSGAETYKMAYNSTSTIAGLHTILTRLLDLPATYGNDSTRKTWMTLLNRLPSISIRYFDGHPTIAPAKAWERLNNKECPQLYPVFPWGLYGIGRPGLDTALNTWKYDTDAIKFRSYIGWKQDNIFAARLGLTEEAAALTVNKLKDSQRRFPTFWGPGFDWTPDHNWGGSGAIGLQEMLLQTDGKKIYLFPAWPGNWDVHFKLHAPYSTTVEATLKHGKIETLKVEPADREKDIIWPGRPRRL